MAQEKEDQLLIVLNWALFYVPRERRARRRGGSSVVSHVIDILDQTDPVSVDVELHFRLAFFVLI